MICDKCGIDLPESVFWDDECCMCHSEEVIKQLKAEKERLWMFADEIKRIREQPLDNDAQIVLIDKALKVLESK